MQIRVVDALDWSGLYIEGECVIQGHSLNMDDALHFLNDKDVGVLDYNYINLTGQQEERLMNEGFLPETLAELEEWNN